MALGQMKMPSGFMEGENESDNFEAAELPRDPNAFLLSDLPPVGDHSTLAQMCR